MGNFNSLELDRAFVGIGAMWFDWLYCRCSSIPALSLHSSNQPQSSSNDLEIPHTLVSLDVCEVPSPYSALMGTTAETL